MKQLLVVLTIFLLSACSSHYVNKDVTNQAFPAISGQALSDEAIALPEAFSGNVTLALVGYKQNSQFDIDRWLIGLNMTQTQVDIFELPMIQGMLPRLFSRQIDNGMRNGIPKDLWRSVITVYKDGDKFQAFTGNTNPNNARVILLDKTGKIVYFHDEGFSVNALNALRSQIDKLS